jgi:hypothetical protein
MPRKEARKAVVEDGRPRRTRQAGGDTHTAYQFTPRSKFVQTVSFAETAQTYHTVEAGATTIRLVAR